MNTKLTLTIEKEVIQIAKEYAKEKGQSLSDLVENYFKLITTEMTEIVGTTKKEILQALRNDFKDFEDSIQYSCALTIKGIKAILTRSIKGYANSKIAVFTPENYLKTKKDKEG